jgi:hypothetical protein
MCEQEGKAKAKLSTAWLSVEGVHTHSHTQHTHIYKLIHLSAKARRITSSGF